MAGFFPSLFAEMGARRRRLRASLGDRGQGIVEFLVLGGLFLGSLGLFVRDWMPAAAPWGFALPFVFVVGYVLIDARRQIAVRDLRARIPQQSEDLDKAEWTRLAYKIRVESDVADEKLIEAEAEFREGAGQRLEDRIAKADATVAASGYDWITLGWSFACALAGAAAFVIAWSAEPPPVQEEEIWTPPESSVSVEISP